MIRGRASIYKMAKSFCFVSLSRISQGWEGSLEHSSHGNAGIFPEIYLRSTNCGNFPEISVRKDNSRKFTFLDQKNVPVHRREHLSCTEECIKTEGVRG
jgi:hypothetical protein